MPVVKRLLVLPLDMADGGLIRYWSEQRHLPNFARLIASGSWFDLESTAQVLHTSTWPTFATGVHPGTHGVYFPYQPRPGCQLAQHVSADQYGAATFWQVADRHGIKSIIYDVPETFPENGFSGTAVFDWGTWAWYGSPCAQPQSLLREIKSRFGRYPLGFEAKRLGARMPDVDIMRERLIRSVDYKRATATWLLQREPWDVAVIGFCEPHPAGHYLWPEDVASVASASEAQISSLSRFYVALDAAVGALLDGVASESTVLVVSGDGVCPNRCAWYLLPAVLERLGYLCPAGGDQGTRPAPRSLVGRAKSLLSARARRRIANLLPWWLRDRIGASEQAANIDWSKTRAFTLPTDLEGCIRINMRGREPNGVVEPGREYVELCEEIRDRMMELTNPITGARAVRRVWIRNEVFPGHRQEQLPDLIVTWNNDAPFRALASTRFGRVEAENADPRPGTHSPEGFLLASGAGVPGGYQAAGRLVDVAPTIMALLGIEVPPHFDGAPLSALIR